MSPSTLALFRLTTLGWLLVIASVTSELLERSLAAPDRFAVATVASAMAVGPSLVATWAAAVRAPTRVGRLAHAASVASGVVGAGVLASVLFADARTDVDAETAMAAVGALILLATGTTAHGGTGERR
jgi:hypothetical protein